MHFLFPQDPQGRNTPEDFFEEQAAAIAAVGFGYSLVGSGVLRRGKGLDGLPAGATVIYRGWMLNAEEYGRLAGAVEEACGTLFTSPREYLAAHHLPNWYSLIPDPRRRAARRGLQQRGRPDPLPRVGAARERVLGRRLGARERVIGNYRINGRLAV